MIDAEKKANFLPKGLNRFIFFDVGSCTKTLDFSDCMDLLIKLGIDLPWQLKGLYGQITSV